MGDSSIQPQGDKLRKCLKWLSEAQRDNPDKTRKQLLREAEIRFDLSPKECEFLDTNFI